MFYFFKKSLQISTFLTCSALICGSAMASSMMDKVNTYKTKRRSQSRETSGDTGDPLNQSLLSPSQLKETFHKVDPRKQAWSQEVASHVNPFFQQPYEEAANTYDDFYQIQDPQTNKRVYRPNHSLAHGIRQAYLAVDIVTMLNGLKKKEYEGTDLEPLVNWIKDKMKKDPSFLRKVEFANAFQRTGRQSEASRKNNKEAYERYLQKDQKNFMDRLGSLKEELFKDAKEIALFQKAITKKYDAKDYENIPEQEKDLFFLSRIFYAAHLLDLRRISHFDKGQVKYEASEALFGHTSQTDVEKKLLTRLWNRSGDYLKATGDRDMENGRGWDISLFVRQAHNPDEMIEALQLARMAPEKTLIDAILNHTHVMREIKEKKDDILDRVGLKKSPFSMDGDEAPTPLAKALKETPYTASESYMKILMGNDYQEIPETASKAQARRITEKNVRAFLASPQPEEHDGSKLKSSKVARIENPEESYVRQLVDCLMAERENRDKVVMYHTTEPEIGFVFDFYTEMRNQLMMLGAEAKKDIRVLRAIDHAFTLLSDRLFPDSPQKKATVKDFMTAYPGTLDNDVDYREMMLSTNFSLFGSDQQKNADTYAMFHKVRDEAVVTQGLGNIRNGGRQSNLDFFFDYIESKTNISFDRNAMKHIQEKYFGDQRNGRLIQIFLSPEAARETTYLSVLMGVPVLQKTTASQTPENPDFLDTLLALRQSPEKFQKAMAGMTGQEVPGHPHLSRVGQLQLHNLQARLFMRPDIMMNPDHVMMTSYWRLGAPDASYGNALQKVVDGGMKQWIGEGMITDEGIFDTQTTRLTSFVDQVFEGQTGSKKVIKKAPKLQEKVAKYYAEGKNTLLKSELETHWDDLKDKTFRLPKKNQNDIGGERTFQDIILGSGSDVVMKLAFDKGFFKGWDAVYDFWIQNIKPLGFLDTKKFFYETLPKMTQPEVAVEVFNRFAQKHPNFLEKMPTRYLTEILEGIGHKYNLSLLEEAYDVCKDPYMFVGFCDAFHAVEDPEMRQKVMDFLSFDNILDQIRLNKFIPPVFLEVKRVIEDQTPGELRIIQQNIADFKNNNPWSLESIFVGMLRVHRANQAERLIPILEKNSSDPAYQITYNFLKELSILESTKEENNLFFPLLLKIFEYIPMEKLELEDLYSMQDSLLTFNGTALKNFEEQLKDPAKGTQLKKDLLEMAEINLN